MPIQTSISQNFVEAVAGQVQGNPFSVNGEHFASAVIAAGQAVELTAAGTLQPCSSSSLRLFGVAMYNAYKQPNAATIGVPATLGEYQVGDSVRVLRKGRIYAQWNGSTNPAFDAAVGVAHSTTTPANAGGFTDAAASATAGSEVANPVGGISLVKNQAYSPATLPAGLALIELNLPA